MTATQTIANSQAQTTNLKTKKQNSELDKIGTILLIRHLTPRKMDQFVEKKSKRKMKKNLLIASLKKNMLRIRQSISRKRTIIAEALIGLLEGYKAWSTHI